MWEYTSLSMFSGGNSSEFSAWSTDLHQGYSFILKVYLFVTVNELIPLSGFINENDVVTVL